MKSYFHLKCSNLQKQDLEEILQSFSEKKFARAKSHKIKRYIAHLQLQLSAAGYKITFLSFQVIKYYFFNITFLKKTTVFCFSGFVV